MFYMFRIVSKFFEQQLKYELNLEKNFESYCIDEKITILLNDTNITLIWEKLTITASVSME